MKFDKYSLLTKKILRIIAKSFGIAEKKSMEHNGFIITARKGWLVKEYKDGTIENLRKL